MSAFTQFLSTLGTQTEDGRERWAKVDEVTFEHVVPSGNKVTVTGAFDPSTGFSGSAELADSTDAVVATATSSDGAETARQLQWLLNSARRSAVDIAALMDALVAELQS